jgi:heme A synthase
MATVHLVVGVGLIVLNLVAGAFGAWRWYRVDPSPLFWRLLRAAQGVVVLQVVLGALLLALGHSPDDDLHILYGALPLAVAFIAEQLRIVSADAVLSSRGHSSAADVGKLPDDEQRIVVLSIVRREMGVMALSCLVIVALALRAATTSGAF